jgi:hypothetical protein
VGFLFYDHVMSFGLLKHFKDLKRGHETAIQTSFTKHVILGHDLGAVLKLVELKKSHPEDSLKLISNRLITKQSLLENHEYGVSMLRSQDSVEAIYKKYFNAKISPQKGEPIFYKDGKFHEFHGRAKSMEILDGESFFSTKGYRISVASLFSEEDWANLDQILDQHQEIRIFESIEKSTPMDLVEKTEWCLSFKDYSKLNCENLYLSMSPKRFINLLTNKEKLTPEIIDLCTGVKVQSAISVTWQLDKEIMSEEKTLFIPQSMTHEWGHFIVEFESDKNLCHVLFLIHEEEPQSEDLAQKIKLMKRVLDRVFPHIENHIKKEFIRFDDEMFISDIKDAALEQVGFDYPTLKFLGQTASVPSTLSNEKFLSRTLLTH